MERIIEFLSQYGSWIIAGTVIVVAAYKRLREGSLGDFLREVIALIVDLAAGELEKVTQEEVMAVASVLYAKLPDWVKLLVSEEAARQAAWAAWQRWLSVRPTVYTPAMKAFTAAGKRKSGPKQRY